MSVGRNDPCPCESGKKYKKCCLLNEQPKAEDLFWHRQHNDRNELIYKIREHADKAYGQIAVLEAWDEFHPQGEEPFNPQSPEIQVFMPWFFYNWTPDPDDTDVNEDAPALIPPAKAFLLANPSSINDLQKEYIKACLDAPFSFLEVIRCEPGQGFTLRDIFTQRESDVVEKRGSEGAQIGDIIFAKPVTVRGLTTLEASSHFMIPPVHKKTLIDFRSHMAKKFKHITEEVLWIFEFEMIDIFQQFNETLLNPKPPILQNTDGDLLVPHKIVFEIESATEAFEALHGLCINETKDTLLKHAVFDPRGGIERIEFPWIRSGNKRHKTWENTVIGHIKIDRTRLTVEVNSEKRAKNFKAELKKRMQVGYKHKSTTIESFEAMMKKNASQGLSEIETQQKQPPEIRASIEKMMAAQWNNWVNEKVPALNNKTPIQAAKTKDGREMLHALLTQFERQTLSHPQIGVTLDTFKNLRKKLGIEK